MFKDINILELLKITTQFLQPFSIDSADFPCRPSIRDGVLRSGMLLYLHHRDSTPGPWLVRFFKSGKNPHDPNPQPLSH